jgi:hypothetical protein
MLCSKLLVAHVPHPNHLVYFHQSGFVNTLLWLNVQIQPTQHSIIEVFYLTCQIKSSFNVSNSVICFCFLHANNQAAFNVPHPNNLVYFRLPGDAHAAYNLF